MKPTEILKEEHVAIKRMLKVIESVCLRLESGEDVSPEHLEQIVGFLRGFADKCHHAKEEDLLFPALEEAGIPGEGGPIGMMLTEHDRGRDYVKGMGETACAYKSGDAEASGKYVKNARNYVALLTEHIEKENNILYPMGDMRVSNQKQKELLAEFERVEQEVIGPGVHEKYHELLHKLEETYAG